MHVFLILRLKYEVTRWHVRKNVVNARAYFSSTHIMITISSQVSFFYKTRNFTNFMKRRVCIYFFLQFLISCFANFKLKYVRNLVHN